MQYSKQLQAPQVFWLTNKCCQVGYILCAVNKTTYSCFKWAKPPQNFIIQWNYYNSQIKLSKLTCFIPPAGGIASFAPGQDLLNWRQTGEMNVVGGCHLSIQSHQGDIKLHSWHSWVLEALVAIDAKHVKALLGWLREGQVVFP